MMGKDIREKIDKNNAIIQENMNLGQFVLNGTVYEKMKENLYLQSICAHQFKDGNCIWCDFEEKNNVKILHD